ncbi:MAG: putative cobaltochelatase [Antricoccus sp.]
MGTTVSRGANLERSRHCEYDGQMPKCKARASPVSLRSRPDAAARFPAGADTRRQENQRPVLIFPFSAIVGSDDMALALVITAVAPEVGGVLVRGEKGTAKSTMVRALAAIMPTQRVIDGCRFGCAPDRPDPQCPDGPHGTNTSHERPARLVELPVGATEDRVIGSLDLQKALGQGIAAYEPGLLASAHRGLLYVDEVNLLHDHLVDLLLDAAAMGRATVEREGVSVSHAARFVLVGTMNPEEGELRPQLLDRFGLTVEVRAPRDPSLRAEVVRRRLAFDADPETFSKRFAADETVLRERITAAQAILLRVQLDDHALFKIAQICAAFEVDGMRADIVTARAAAAHAAWDGREKVTKADIRAAARLALPHRRRRNPFDAPGLDEDLLDQILNEEPEPEPEPDNDPAAAGPDPEPDNGSDGVQSASQEPKSDSAGAHPDDSSQPHDQGAERQQTQEQPQHQSHETEPPPSEQAPQPANDAASQLVAGVREPYRTRLLSIAGVGNGEAGKRSRAITAIGRTVRVASPGSTEGALHLPATIRAAALRQSGRVAGGRLPIDGGDLRRAIREGRESNLVLFCVDASGSMAARKRMEAVKTAILSLLLDAYQRRDKVGLVTFRGQEAVLALPPTTSIDTAARRLADLPSGGRTPLAEGLMCAERTLRLERIRDPRRRALLVVITDGRATSGVAALKRSQAVAGYLGDTGINAIVIDCETGRFRIGLAAQLAERLGAQYLPLENVGADALLNITGIARKVA